jgi:hypothetical protein
MKVPLYEDVAALVGIVIAAGGLFVTQSTGDTVYDGIASIGVGVVLSVVAFQLGTDSRAPDRTSGSSGREATRARDHRALRRSQ